MDSWERTVTVVASFLAIAGALYAVIIKGFPGIEKKVPVFARVGLLTIAVLLIGGASFYLGTEVTSFGALASPADQQAIEFEIRINELQDDNKTLQEQISSLEKENLSLKQRVQELEQELAKVSVTDPSPVQKPSPSASSYKQNVSSTAYTIVGTENNGGTITVHLTALNEGSETDECMYNISMFDSQGNSRGGSQIVINGESERVGCYGCGCYALPTGIARNISVVFEGLSADEDLIQELRLDNMRFRDVPIPFTD